MTSKGIRRLQAFSSAIRRTFVQLFTRFNWQHACAVPPRQLGFLLFFVTPSKKLVYCLELTVCFCDNYLVVLLVIICVVTGMFGPVLSSLLVFISTSTVRTGHSGMPDLKTWCHVYFHDLIGLSHCRICIMLYSHYIFMHLSYALDYKVVQFEKHWWRI